MKKAISKMQLARRLRSFNFPSRCAIYFPSTLRSFAEFVATINGRLFAENMNKRQLTKYLLLSFSPLINDITIKRAPLRSYNDVGKDVRFAQDLLHRGER